MIKIQKFPLNYEIKLKLKESLESCKIFKFSGFVESAENILNVLSYIIVFSINACCTFESNIYEVGDRVKIRSKDTEEWKFGKVTSTDPIKVQADGGWFSYKWNYIESMVTTTIFFFGILFLSTPIFLFCFH